MTRKRVRENLFRMLFRIDFHQKEEWDDQVSAFLEELEGAGKGVKEELKNKFYAVTEHMEEIDQVIEAKSNGWSLVRMAKADVTILRLAAYEIIFDDTIPNGVAINEAVELSKLYGTAKSAAFINGVLASVAREHPQENGE